MDPASVKRISSVFLISAFNQWTARVNPVKNSDARPQILSNEHISSSNSQALE